MLPGVDKNCRQVWSLRLVFYQNRLLETAAYLENREGGGLGGGRRRAPYPRTQRGRRTVVIGGTIRRNFLLLEGAWRTGTFRSEFSSLESAEGALQPHFPYKTFAGAEQTLTKNINRRRTNAKGAFGAQGGGHGPVAPCLRLWLETINNN